MRSCIERAFQRLRGYCAKKTNCDNCHSTHWMPLPEPPGVEP